MRVASATPGLREALNYLRAPAAFIPRANVASVPSVREQRRDSSLILMGLPSYETFGSIGLGPAEETIADVSISSAFCICSAIPGGILYFAYPDIRCYHE